MPSSEDMILALAGQFKQLSREPVSFIYNMPWEVRLALYSTFVPPTSAIVCGLSFSRSQPDLSVFLLVIRFSSLSKSKTSGLDAVLRDHVWPFGNSLTRLWYKIGRSCLSCAIQPSGLQVWVISVVYRKRKLVAFCILWDMTVEKKQKSTARRNKCCCYKHEFLSFCPIDTTISRTLLHVSIYQISG